MTRSVAPSGKWISRLLAIVLASVGYSCNVLAHDTLEGAGALTNGLIHPFVVPAHLLVLVSCGLLIGQRGQSYYYPGMISFSVALALGLGLSDTYLFNGVAVLIGCAVVGLFIAANLNIPRLSLAAFVAAMGLMLGLDSGPEALTGWERFSALTGVWIASVGFMSWLFIVAVSAKRPWQNIAIRVLGSWVSAASVMVLALTFA